MVNDYIGFKTLDLIIGQIDYSNSFYVEQAVLRFMLHVSHIMREKGPNMLQIITENSQPSDAVTLMTDIATKMASMEVTMMKMMMKKRKEDGDNKDFCTGKPT